MNWVIIKRCGECVDYDEVVVDGLLMFVCKT